jgi:L-2-hydroxyglutarate oxidase LhgO
MAHPGGRPTKYTAEMPAKVDEYLADCKVWWDEFHKTRGEKSDTYERILNVKLPMVEGFAEYIDVTKSTLYEWAKENKEFSNALDRIIRQQHNMLATGGIAGYFSPVITKLMLSNNHGYREKSETDVTSGGEKLKINVVAYGDNNSPQIPA